MEFNRQEGGVARAAAGAARSTPAWASSASPRSSRARPRTTTPTCSSRSSTAIGDLAGRTLRRRRPRPTSRCASSPITCARTTFLIADGVIPSNEWRGYVLRKIMRRAMRHGKRLGLRDPFLHRLVDVVVAEMGEAYPELRGEPRRGRQRGQGRRGTVRRGADRRTPAASRSCSIAPRRRPTRRVPGDEVFRLYDSLGVPVDFIEDLASERQLAARSRGLRARDGRPARAGPGRQHASSRRRRPAFTFASDAARDGARADAGSLRRLRRRPRSTMRRSSRSSTRRARRSTTLAAGAQRLRRHRSHAVLPRSRRPGVRHRHAVRRTPARPTVRRRRARRRRAGRARIASR